MIFCPISRTEIFIQDDQNFVICAQKILKKSNFSLVNLMKWNKCIKVARKPDKLFCRQKLGLALPDFGLNGNVIDLSSAIIYDEAID